jgi:hypothetical protein
MPDSNSWHEADNIRLARVEERLLSAQEDIATILKTVEELKKQSQWVRGGIVLIVAVGGLFTWISNIWEAIRH